MFENIVSDTIKKSFELNSDEMKRRRGLLKKLIRTTKEDRELEILNLRDSLLTLEDITHSINLLAAFK